MNHNAMNFKNVKQQPHCARNLSGELSARAQKIKFSFRNPELSLSTSLFQPSRPSIYPAFITLQCFIILIASEDISVRCYS